MTGAYLGEVTRDTALELSSELGVLEDVGLQKLVPLLLKLLTTSNVLAVEVAHL